MKQFLYFFLFVNLMGQAGIAGHQPAPPDFTRGAARKKIEPRKKEASEFGSLREYLAKEKEKTAEKSKSWAEKILQAMDTRNLETVRKVVEEFLIEDQMFLDVEQEKQAFGKPLKEFTAAERKELVLKITMGQKEVREKLLTEVSQLIQASGKPGASELGAALQDIKKDHLEAYDRVIKEIKAGTIDTSTTFCFTCGEGEPIGSDGYTFGGAMEEAASRVVAAFAEAAHPPAVPPKQEPIKVTEPNPPAKNPEPVSPPQPKMSQIEVSARRMIENPVMQGSRRSGGNRSTFEGHMKTLKADPSLSVETLKRFLKAGPYGNNNPSYRSKIDSMSREQLLKAVEIFLNGEGPYNHCPSCNLGAGRRL